MSELPLYDVNLNAETFNIFRPIKTILPYNLPKLEKIKIDQTPDPASATSSKAVTSDINDTYCKICKKKFNNTATLNNHLKSAIHIANEKKASSPFKPAASTPTVTPTVKKTDSNDTYCKACKKKFTNAATFDNHLKSAKHIANDKKTASPFKPKASTNVSEIPQKITVNPQVQDALNKLEQAKVATDPTIAVSTYWNQSQVLFGLQRPQYVETSLKSLIDALDRPSLSFTSAQITSFRYSSQLALSRLLCLYQDLDTSRMFYLQALESKWKILSAELLDLAKQVRLTSVASLLASCDTLATKYLTRERNRTKAAPPLSDPNNAFTVILNEAASLFAQEGHIYNDIPCEQIAIVLYGICSLVCPFEQHQKPQDCYFLMNQVYTLLPDLSHRVVELKLLDVDNAWNLYDAMLLSIETDDIVLAKQIQQHMVNKDQPDVVLLCNILEKKLTFTQDVDLQHDFDHIQLLINQSMTDSLYMGSQSRKTQELTLARLEHLM